MPKKSWFKRFPKPAKGKPPKVGHYTFHQNNIEWVTFSGQMESLGVPPVSLNITREQLMERDLPEPDTGSSVRLTLWGKVFNCIVIQTTDVMDGDAITLTMQVIK